MNKPPSVTVLKWLRDNGHNLGALTSQDTRALLASVQLVPLWYQGKTEIAAAWGTIVREMQPQCRQYSFHAVAHVYDWGHRAQLWREAGFDEPPRPLHVCKIGPSGFPGNL